MNREERRKLGITKETSDKLENLKSPCTILEAIELSQGVADDAITNYHKSINPIIVSLSLQVEVLKSMLFSDGCAESSILLEHKFNELFKERAAEYNKQKEEAFSKLKENVAKQSKDMPSTDVNVSDVEMKVE